ncbi:AAA family ATPase [Mycolicibacterium sp. J2]|uniref:AAA family ATPase n=1 Tax=Mycolicibacterium sp. J2 TaxID=2993511 RepID=UPI00224B2678|nr:AAA family ATPase [Mycolicibacterium sp. J2]MCX2714230.1 AAA family ATPase [Mycolicibacterium sp. J2]
MLQHYTDKFGEQILLLGGVPVTPIFGGTQPMPSIPDVTGLSAFDAALAYAAVGLYVLPVAAGKHPGSVVGLDWPHKSTRDPDDIEFYWGTDQAPGIAIHAGPSLLVVIDLDVDAVPDELAWLRKGLFQSSRNGRSERGHYVFASAEVFTNSAVTLADGTEVGEVRSGNAVIMAQPSPHPNAANGGGYVWQSVGEIPELPEQGRGYLTTRAGGVAAAAVTDEQVAAFCARTAKSNARPKALAHLAASVSERRTRTRDGARDALRIAAGEARIGFYPFDRAVNEIKRAAAESYRLRGEDFDAHIGVGEYARLVANAVGSANSRSFAQLRAEADREYGTDSRDGIDLRPALRLIAGSDLPSETDSEPCGGDRSATAASAAVRARFSGVSAAELGAPVEPMRWLVRGVWPQRSAGVLAGEKKTFKTWNLQALALAVASGVPFLGQFDVPTPGPVLYLCGEGGRDGFANRHQVIAKRYGIGPDDLADLSMVAEFDTDELTSAELRDGIARHLDRLQPVLVILDPLYAYHPASVEAANLYARGPMLAALRELIEPGAALIIGDHFKKGAGDGLDLDHISMAGVGQWADTWALQRHRTPPDLATNDYRIEVEFSTRRGGGHRWNIDWHLDRDPNPDLVAWSDARWAVSAPQNGSNGSRSDIEIAILAEIGRRPWALTRSTLHAAVGGRKQTVLDAVKRLLDGRELAERAPAKGGGKANVLGPGKVVAVLAGGGS